MLKIKRGLEADGILNGAGNEKWHTSNINQILRNEKYIGDALLQKTYTTDFLTKARVKNHGVVPQYYVENSHDLGPKRQAVLLYSPSRLPCEQYRKTTAPAKRSRPVRIL